MDPKPSTPKLVLDRETIRTLTNREQQQVAAGIHYTQIPFSAQARCTRDWQDTDLGTTCNAACA